MYSIYIVLLDKISVKFLWRPEARCRNSISSAFYPHNSSSFFPKLPLIVLFVLWFVVSNVSSFREEVIIKAVLYDLFESMRDLCRKMTILLSSFAVSRLRLSCLRLSRRALNFLFWVYCGPLMLIEVIIRADLYDLIESMIDLCRKMTIVTGQSVLLRLVRLCMSCSSRLNRYFDVVLFWCAGRGHH